MKINHYLVLSSCLLIIPIIYFICNFKNNNFKILAALLLSLNIILSILFWRKAEYKSIIHKLDGLFAKLSFIYFILYILFLKEYNIKYHKRILIIFFIIILILFYFSDKYSKKSWCSRKHIIVHSIFHLFITTGSLIAFI